jgi:CBS domain-containing protein
MSRVRDIVQDRQLFYVEETGTITEVARFMAEVGVGAILVLKGTTLSGIFSERDLMKRVVLEGIDPDRTSVSRVMSRDLVTVDEDAAVEQALELMQSNNCRHLPVMREDSVAAFLSMRDLMNYELARKTEELAHMRTYIAGS